MISLILGVISLIVGFFLLILFWPVGLGAVAFWLVVFNGGEPWAGVVGGLAVTILGYLIYAGMIESADQTKAPVLPELRSDYSPCAGCGTLVCSCPAPPEPSAPIAEHITEQTWARYQARQSGETGFPLMNPETNRPYTNEEACGHCVSSLVVEPVGSAR
jgi:hypothetical protein